MRLQQYVSVFDHAHRKPHFWMPDPRWIAPFNLGALTQWIRAMKPFTFVSTLILLSLHTWSPRTARSLAPQHKTHENAPPRHAPFHSTRRAGRAPSHRRRPLWLTEFACSEAGSLERLNAFGQMVPRPRPTPSSQVWWFEEGTHVSCDVPRCEIVGDSGDAKVAHLFFCFRPSIWISWVRGTGRRP